MAKILLAEDDSAMRSFIASSLRKAGHDVTDCADGTAALAEMEAGTVYDLLLTDIVMPGMDGLELSARASGLLPDIKTMFITGFAAMAAGRPQAHRPDVKLISKPFHLGNLIEEVEKLLNRE